MKLEKTPDINFLNKTIALIFILFLIVSSVSSIKISSDEKIFFTADTSRDITWAVTLNFTETGGKKDYAIFGEAYNASDNLDSYDIPNPPVGIPPFLDAYFSTNFSLPHDRLMQEIKKYPAAYKEWNFTVWWTGSDTTVTISWNTTEIAQTEYDAIKLCDDVGMPLVDMLDNNNYVFVYNSGMASFKVICSSNQPPVANNDSYSVDEDVMLVIGVPGVLVNDTDFDGPDDLTAFLDGDVDHGTLDLDSNGSFEYVPDGDWFGVDSFTYHAFDGLNDSNVATVFISVGPVNDPPVVDDIPGETILEGGSFATFDLDDYVADPDNSDDELTWIVSGNVSLIVDIDGGHVVTITPPSLEWNGEETVVFNATDPLGLGDEDAAVFNVTAENDPPMIFDENPPDGSTGVERSPGELNITIEDPDNDTMDVYIRWKNHSYNYSGEWITLQTYIGVNNGTYNFIPPEDSNDWIWGNTTYIWSVNVTDGTTWTNDTYYYTTGGSRYDVNNNDEVNFQDAGLVWIHRTSEVAYDGLYDVNGDGQVNFQDAGLTWINRD